MQRLLIRAVRVGLLMVLSDIGLAPVMSPGLFLIARPNARPALTCLIEDSTILLSACHEISGTYSEGELHEAAAYRSARAGLIRTNGCCTAGRRQQCCGPINQGKLVQDAPSQLQIIGQRATNDRHEPPRLLGQ